MIADSYARLLGRPLIAHSADSVLALWQAPLAIVAHGAERDPCFFFGNLAALSAFEFLLEDFVGLPSRLSAEAPERAARQDLLDRVARHGFIEDYRGIRVTRTGRRFEIRDAVVWNLMDTAGDCHGQAACFIPPKTASNLA